MSDGHEPTVDRRLPPVGLGDLVDVVAVLGLEGEQIATAAELLRLRPRAAVAVPPRRVRTRPHVPVPPKPAVARAPAPGGRAVPEEEYLPSLPAAVTEAPAERVALPLAPRSLNELLPTVPTPRPEPASLFRPGTRRALLRGVSAVRERDGDIDVDAVVDMLAAHRTLDRIPLEWVDTTRGELVLLLDGSVAMDPFRVDLDRLPDELARVVGLDGLKVRWFEDCPTGPEGVMMVGDEEPRPFVLPGARTRLLAVTTFGVRGTLEAPPEVAKGWRRLAARCRRADVPLLVLTPLPPARRPPGVAAVTWDRATSVRDVLRAERSAR